MQTVTIWIVFIVVPSTTNVIWLEIINQNTKYYNFTISATSGWCPLRTDYIKIYFKFHINRNSMTVIDVYNKIMK